MALYLVTGGCGFIGSHLCDALIAAGHDVRVLDDLSTGRRTNLPQEAELLVGDVADRALMEAALAGTAGCFHLAAVASVQRSNEDWLGTHRTNQTGTITVLEAARQTRIPVVYASSAAVYGDQKAMPLHEAHPAAPLTAYGADKLGSELHARVAARAHGVPTLGLRFFNVYGPRQDPQSPYSGVIAIFAGRIARGQDVTVYGDGQQLRDFVYVGDVVRFLMVAMEHCSLEARVLNVCTGRPTSVLDLAHSLAELQGVPPRIRFAPPRPGDIRTSIGSPEAAAAVLGLRAATPVTEGLACLLAYQREPALAE